MKIRSRHHTATYLPFGSFQSPSPRCYRQPNTHKRIQDPQSPDMIKREVTSYAVKPLYARPCFPKQAQMFQIQNSMPRHTERFAQQGPVATPSSKPTRKVSSDESFVYIHRHNSFIDVSQMTHHDHSHPVKKSSNDLGRSSPRSPQEVDAAMTLATCLHK
jgi:hypothetical protein